jgi:hypothetical protein
VVLLSGLEPGTLLVKGHNAPTARAKEWDYNERQLEVRYMKKKAESKIDGQDRAKQQIIHYRLDNYTLSY